jgi:hypothetical protein
MIRRLTFWLRLWGRTCVLPASLIARPTNGADEKKEEAEILLGGQAVLEGVMMRAPQSYCVAVRAPGGEIVQKREALARPQDRWRGWRLPGLRGLATLGQSLVLGLRALRFSADVALEEESKKTGKKQELPGWLLALQLVFSLAFFIFLYKFVPLLVATWFKNRGLEGGCFWPFSSPSRGGATSGACSSTTAPSTWWSTTGRPSSRYRSATPAPLPRSIPAAAPAFWWWCCWWRCLSMRWYRCRASGCSSWCAFSCCR